MRVLLWSELYRPYIGGAEIFAAQLAGALRPRGVEFLVVTSHHDRDLPDRDVEEGMTVRRLTFRAAIGGRDVKRFAGITREVAAIKRDFAPDLIHVNAVGPSLMFHLRTTEACRAPVLVTLQQEVLASQRAGSGTLLAHTVESADWVVGCSEAVLDQVRGAHPSVLGRSSRIYNGFEPPPVAPTPLPERAHVVCLGRLVPAKGFDIALRAFARVAARRPAARFTIAGDGAARDDLRALAAELGLAERVAFPGWIEPNDVPRLLNQASIVVMPSRREGMPVVGVQAALMARPIVATPVGGLPEIVRDGESGILVAVEDAGALTEAILGLLDDRTAATAMGARGRRHALRDLDWGQTVSNYHELYRALAD
ncbi:MAG: hypothetical protein QOF77_771 [Solirubrobacteraceae bacterium]|jgi:glycogen(starch) synthase|nr:hypothetical protein [Solirubrobacteraceae bacterium]